jgi:hypothetical protein
MKNILLFILFILSSTAVFSQNSTLPTKAYFGIQYKPLIAGDFIGSSRLLVKNDTIQGEFTQQLGASFGGVIRVQFKKNIAIETGINQVQRHYNIQFSRLDSAITSTKSLKIVAFDVPVNLLFFVKLSDKIFMNTSLGPSFVFNPSNVQTTAIFNKYNLFRGEGRMRSVFAVEMNANLGFEYRTEKSGFFYLGASARVPFKPIFDVAVSHENTVTHQKMVLYGNMTGTYISFDIRYFFPYNKYKTSNKIDMPIEQ